MKKLFFGLIATVMLCSSVNAQKIESGKISNGKESIDIPKEVVSELKYVENSSDFTTITKFSKSYDGNITLIVDSKNKVVAVVYPPSVSTSKLGPIGRCFKGCNAGGSSESGAWLCYWVCITGI